MNIVYLFIAGWWQAYRFCWIVCSGRWTLWLLMVRCIVIIQTYMRWWQLG